MRAIDTLTKTFVADAKNGNNPTVEPLDLELANNVFKVLHGSYPKFFLSNFETGQLDQSGHDKGVKNGRNMWARKLIRFSEQVIGAALDQCLERHVEYPPNLPQFLALCRANQPRATYAEQCLALPDHAPRVSGCLNPHKCGGR